MRSVASGEVRVLERRGGTRVYLFPGQVNGDDATWTVCIDPTCTAYRYQISTQTRVELPKTGGAATYGSSVTPEGTVYYGLSANACGVRVRIVRWGGSGAPTVVQQLPNSLDFMFSYAVREEDGSTSVLYDRGGCGRGATSDIYKVVDLPSGF